MRLRGTIKRIVTSDCIPERRIRREQFYWSRGFYDECERPRFGGEQTLQARAAWEGAELFADEPIEIYRPVIAVLALTSEKRDEDARLSGI